MREFIIIDHVITFYNIDEMLYRTNAPFSGYMKNEGKNIYVYIT